PRSRKADTARNRVGAPRRRAYRREADRDVAIPFELGAVVGARHLGRAVSYFQRRVAPAPCRGRFRRISAARSRSYRRGLSPQSPTRAEAAGAVKPDAFALRAYTDADEPAAIELWQRTWQAVYPDIDFSARVEWWRERWRSELVPACTIMVIETGGAAGAARTAGFVPAPPAPPAPSLPPLA